MRAVLAILFRCFLALGLGFTPLANAFDMAAMTAHHSREDAPPCHAPGQEQHDPDGKCCGVGHCHCSMATALPTDVPVIAHSIVPSDHPQTVRQLTLAPPISPDTPPPRT